MKEITADRVRDRNYPTCKLLKCLRSLCLELNMF